MHIHVVVVNEKPEAAFATRLAAERERLEHLARSPGSAAVVVAIPFHTESGDQKRDEGWVPGWMRR